MNIPLSLYIHIPWCVQKCPYCDFNSHKASEQLPESDYITRLLDDLADDIDRFAEKRRLTSIFIGGGTPSLLTGSAIKRLLEGVNQQLQISDDTEITLEANPGTVDERHFADYRTAGVNRLSIGIQSFDNEQLKHLGRIHNHQEATNAVNTAREAGFDNINIDIMFGLPHQNEAQAIADIEQGIALGTEHLSYYQLTLEPNTLFAQHPPKLPPEPDIDKRFNTASQLLQQAGFSQYEVSAWSRGRRAQHNLNYWQYGDYLGIGAGAHGKITLNTDTSIKIIRTTKPRSPKHYLSGTSVLRHERLVNDDEKAFEFMLNTMRLTEGFSRQWINERGLVSENTILPTLSALAEKELLAIKPNWIAPTPLGRRFVNDMVEAFL